MLKAKEIVATTTQGSITNHLPRTKELRGGFYGWRKLPKRGFLSLGSNTHGTTHELKARVCDWGCLFNLNSSCGSLFVALCEPNFEDTVLVSSLGCPWINKVRQFHFFEVTSLRCFYRYLQCSICGFQFDIVLLYPRKFCHYDHFVSLLSHIHEWFP